MNKQRHFDKIVYDKISLLHRVLYFGFLSNYCSTPKEHAIFSSGRCGSRYQN